MKILAATFAYNEEPYLPAWVRYYENQGCEMLVVDNYSTDGTHKWCGEHGLHTGKVDTNEAFHLATLQRVLVAEIFKIKPDWVIYAGIDLFQIFPLGIRKTIEDAEKQKCNLIEVDHYEAFNTGEKTRIPLPANYFYMRKHGRLRMTGKWDRGLRLFADEVILGDPRVYQSDGILINYGMCKAKEEREITLARRQKAWDMGLHKGWGTHYRPAQSIDWKWDKNTLRDMKKTPEYELIKQTQKGL